MELTKKEISAIKYNEDKIEELLSRIRHDNSRIIYFLDNLGRISNNFNGDWLFELAKSDNQKIRLSAIKNLGKISLNGKLEKMFSLFSDEENTENRREIISSIGRQRNYKAKNFLIKTLQDNDPKVVSQAIRALLVFKDDEEIVSVLKSLRNHKNEMVSMVIEKEFFSKTTNKSNLHHTETYDFLKNTVVHGDVNEILKYVPDESVHLTFTSPPYYNARDYSIYPSYKDYLEFLEKVFKQIHRVTKEGRFLLINTSPIIIPRISRQHSSIRYPIPFDLHHYIVQMGWEYIDDIIWLKPEASVKNRVGGFQQHRKPLGYKPNTVTEMIMVYRKKTSKLLDWNIRQYPYDIVKESKVADDFETTNVWKIDPVYSKNHSAVFPTELCQKVIQYYSFVGDLVFDPFGGSGTLGRAAKALNRRFFLTELNDEYFNYMKSIKKGKSLFNEPESKFLEIEEFKKIANDIN